MSDFSSIEKHCFSKFNILNSKSIDDVKKYTAASHNLSNLPKNEISYITYFTNEEMKYANDWKYKNFKYKINELGFRFVDKLNEVDLAVFGCSFTFGVGLPNDYLWHDILSNKLGKTCLNFGLPGGSATTAIELFLIVSKHIKIKTAIFLLPNYLRIQIAKKHPISNDINHLHLIPSYSSQMCKYYKVDDSAIFKVLPEDEILKRFCDIVYLGDYIATDRNINCYYSSWDTNTYGFLQNMDLNGIVVDQWRSLSKEQEENDLARDKKHPGPEHHQMFAETLLRYIK